MSFDGKSCDTSQAETRNGIMLNDDASEEQERHIE